MITQIWNNHIIGAEEFLHLPPLKKFGICRRIHPNAKYDNTKIRGLVTDFETRKYHYTSSYSCSADKIPIDVHMTKLHPIRECFISSFDIFTKYRSDTFNMVDVDLLTLHEIIELGHLHLSKNFAKRRLHEYLDSLRVDNIPELVWTHAILSMNMSLLYKTPIISEEEADKITEFSQQRFKEEIAAMRLKLHAWIDSL